MAWFWSDDLARLLIARDGVSPRRVADWIAGPTAHRSDLDALAFARALLGDAPPASQDDEQTSAA